MFIPHNTISKYFHFRYSIIFLPILYFKNRTNFKIISSIFHNEKKLNVCIIKIRNILYNISQDNL